MAQPTDLTSREFMNMSKPKKVLRNFFDLSKRQISTYRLGEIYPIMVQEVLPNDRIELSHQYQLQMEALVGRLYCTIRVKIEDYFISYRGMWKKFKNFYTKGRKGDYTPEIPIYNIANKFNVKHGLLDYLELPLFKPELLNGRVHINAFPLVAYDEIYWWHKINRHIEENVLMNIVDDIYEERNIGDNGVEYLVDDIYFQQDNDARQFYTRLLKPNKGENYGQFLSRVDTNFLHRVNWNKDYFTSAHLVQQLGTPPDIPITSRLTNSFKDGEYASIGYISSSLNDIKSNNTLDTISGSQSVNMTRSVNTRTATQAFISKENIDWLDKITVTSAGININDLIYLNAINQLQIDTLLGGYDFHDFLDYNFGISPSDYDLSRPVKFGSYSSQFYTGIVMQTSPTADSPLGSYAGQGSADGYSRRAEFVAKEPGLVMSIMYFKVDPIYSSQGIPRMYTKTSSYDWFKPQLSGLPEQEIRTHEIFNDNTKGLDESVFGFTGAWNELRTNVDNVTSDMRDILQYSHLARSFAESPKLNAQFIKMNPDELTRIFAINGKDVSYPIQGVVNSVYHVWRDLKEVAMANINPM